MKKSLTFLSLVLIALLAATVMPAPARSQSTQVDKDVGPPFPKIAPVFEIVIDVAIQQSTITLEACCDVGNDIVCMTDTHQVNAVADLSITDITLDRPQRPIATYSTRYQRRLADRSKSVIRPPNNFQLE